VTIEKSAEKGLDYRPLVSVIMNCFNGEKYLEGAIDSVLNQSYQNWEIIFWDNQSCDQSANIVKSYNDPRIKYFYAPSHTFLYEARNYACEKASGSLLSFLDVDDLWLPEKLEQQIQIFSDPEICFSFTNYFIEDTRQDKKWLAFKKFSPKNIGVNDLLCFYNVGLLTLILRRSSLLPHRLLFNPRFHIIGDFDLVIRLAAIMKFSYIKEPLAVYRIHGANESSKRKDLIISELEYWVSEQSKNSLVTNACSHASLEMYLNYHRAMQALSLSKRIDACLFINKMPWCYLKVKLLFKLVVPKKYV
jgi:glycosyltransferase involved in cell wall biosynthesis